MSLLSPLSVQRVREKLAAARLSFRLMHKALADGFADAARRFHEEGRMELASARLTVEANRDDDILPSMRCLFSVAVIHPRLPTDREVTSDAVEVRPSTSRPGLRLLCLLVPSRTGKARSLPVHTLHRVPPYASLHGRYYDGQGCGSVALDPLDVPGGTGFYLRETHARAPSAEVLARYLRQRQADSLRADPRSLRVGGLSHAH